MKSNVWRISLVLLVASMTCWSAVATARLAPAAGRFLVATHQQHGFFAKSVILLIAYGPSGALGVVVNHPTKLSLAEVLPNPSVLRGRTDVLYLGGPVALDSLTMLIRSQSAPPGSVHVLADVFASGNLAALGVAVSRKLTGASFRAYAGYAGWAPGQLNAELEAGAWIVVSADARDVFTKAPGKLWGKLNPQGNAVLVEVRPLGTDFTNRYPDLRFQPLNSVRRNSITSGQARSAAAGA